MLPLSVFHPSNLGAIHKHTEVYITCETHPEGEKSTLRSHPVSPPRHVSITGTSI